MARRSFGTVIQQPSGKYIGKYKHEGKYHKTVTRVTKREVQQDLAMVQASILSGTWQPKSKAGIKPSGKEDETGRKIYTYNDVFKLICEYHKRNNSSENTFRTVHSTWNAYILPVIGKLPIEELRDEHLHSLIKRPLKDGKSPEVTNRILSFTKSGILEAERAGLIKKGTVTADFGLYWRKKSKKKQRTALTMEELERVIENTAPSLRLAMVLAGVCALRSGEVTALNVEDIDRGNWSVTVNKAVQRKASGELVLATPKTRASYRTVAIPERFRRYVDTHLEEYVTNDSSLLFYNPEHPKGYTSGRVLLGELKAACQRAETPIIVFHELRHTALTLYGQTGATLADIMRRAGHSDIQSAMIYQHSDFDRDTELANRM